MRKPKPLQKNDTIGLIGASSATPKEKLDSAIKSIEKLGFQVVVGESCYSMHGYLSGTDDIRANDVNKMFADSSIDGIFCVRGGYGATRILDKLDYESIQNNPKVFAGYSDVTAFHIAFNQICNFVTFHAPMASTELNKTIDMHTRSSFIHAITSPDYSGEVQNPPGLKMKSLVEGSATGQLIGGNLSLVCATLGTPYEIDTKNKILFLEDVDEYTYRIDRMLTQLKLAGKLDDAAGIILGGWTNCGADNPEKSLTLEQVFNEILVPTGKPIITDVVCGHCLPTITLPLGAMVTMNTNNSNFIRVE